MVFAKYIRLYESIEIFNLYNELELVENSLREKIYRNNDERKLNELMKLVMLVKQLYVVEVNNKEYQYVKTHAGDFTSSSCAAIIKQMCKKYKVQILGEYDLSTVFDNIGDGLKFYEDAEKRDKALLSNTVMRMRADGKHVAALITGGYHTKGLTELMQKQQLSYLVVIPKFKEGTERPYIAVLTGKKKVYEEIVKLDIWNWNEPILYTEQLNSLKQFSMTTNEVFLWHILNLIRTKHI